MTNFVFEDINDKGRATKGEFQYYIDNESGEILFKTKYDFEEFDYYSLKFVIKTFINYYYSQSPQLLF